MIEKIINYISMIIGNLLSFNTQEEYCFCEMVVLGIFFIFFSIFVVYIVRIIIFHILKDESEIR